MALITEFGNIITETFIIFLSTLCVIFGYPLLFISLLICLTYKKVAVKLAQKDPRTRKLLEGIDAVYAGQDPYNDPLIVVAPYVSLANKLNVPTVVRVLKEKVIVPNIYPELTQRIVRQYGYHFWYDTENFEVENHVRYLKLDCPNMPITRTELRDIINNQVGKVPFDSAKSPWEVLVVPHVIDDRDPEIKSVFILRVNHCLMDGYSMINFLQKVALKPWKTLGGETIERRQNQKFKLVKLHKLVMLLFSAPYHFLKMFAFTKDDNQFIQNTYKSDFKEVYNSQCTPAIPESRLKLVKNAYGVTMSSLIITLFGQATWKCMKKAGIPMPKIIHGLLSFPLPGHQDVLSNHWTLVRIPIKVDENDPVKTLMFVENEFQSLRNTVKPLLFFYANKLIALAPLWLRLNTKYITPTSFLLSNFPGPTEPCDIFGCTWKQFNCGGKPSRGIPCFCGSFSSVGKFWLDNAGPICNFPNQQDADFLSAKNMDTLKYLEAAIPRN